MSLARMIGSHPSKTAASSASRSTGKLAASAAWSGSMPGGSHSATPLWSSTSCAVPLCESATAERADEDREKREILPWVGVRPTRHRIGAKGEHNDGDRALPLGLGRRNGGYDRSGTFVHKSASFGRERTAAVQCHPPPRSRTHISLRGDFGWRRKSRGVAATLGLGAGSRRGRPRPTHHSMASREEVIGDGAKPWRRKWTG